MIDTQNSRLVGYARVSTSDQELALQIDALSAHGVTKESLFCDKLSGAKEDRPGLVACLASLEREDMLVVWRLDRLGRSMRHLVNMIEDLKERGIGFRSISDGMIDTTSASGELVLNIFSALAQFERRLIQERTNAGLAAARSRGRKGGRPGMHRNHPKVVLPNKLYCDKSACLEDICTTLKISKSTLYRYVSMRGNRDARAESQLERAAIQPENCERSNCCLTQCVDRRPAAVKRRKRGCWMGWGNEGFSAHRSARPHLGELPAGVRWANATGLSRGLGLRIRANPSTAAG